MKKYIVAILVGLLTQVGVFAQDWQADQVLFRNIFKCIEIIQWRRMFGGYGRDFGIPQ